MTGLPPFGDVTQTGAVFGDPDGARADLAEFVDPIPTGNLRFTPRVSTRIVAGKQGAGKTLWLRHLAADLRLGRDWHISTPDYISLPSTRSIVRFSSLFRPTIRAEMWQLTWDRAILRAIASQLHAPALLPYATSEFLETIERQHLDDLVPKRASSPYAEMKALISDSGHATRVVKHLEDSRWDELRSLLSDWMEGIPPLFFAVDAIDEEFASAPSHWLACQKGLFLAVMRLLRDQRLGGRTHVVVALRDLVLSAIAVSEHGPRFLADRHVQLLDWDDNQLKALCLRKLRAVLHLEALHDDEMLSSWLGFDTITDSAGSPESAWSYLYRHTRSVPRDLILLMNALHVRRGADGWSKDAFRAEVRRQARLFGYAQLALVRNELLAMAIGEFDPSFYAYDLKSDFSPAQDDTDGYWTILTNLLRASAASEMNERSLGHLRETSTKTFGVDIADVLWRHGLLGVVRDFDQHSSQATARFHRTSEWDSLELPAGVAHGFALHPCLSVALDCDQIGDRVVPTY